ncbi:MAG: restriction endonuclease subunit S, partial [Phascolarctobacterium sp.]
NNLFVKISDVEMVELGDVCHFIRGPFGGALKKEIFQPTGYAVYEQQHAIYKNLDIRYFIDNSKYEELKRFRVKPGDIIVSCSGTIGKTFVIPDNSPAGIINQALLKLTPCDKLNVYYLQYFFENTIVNTLNDVSRGGAIKNVPSVGELKKIKIPLPSLVNQQRIVDILDRFDALCNDITSGLPAEIEARRKQYEYYRDKLLTFKELKKEA